MSAAALLLVCTGGFAGAICRYWIGLAAKRLTGQFPAGTFIVNVVGALLLGYLWTSQVPHAVMLFMSSGFLGALTTYSTLHLDILRLYTSERRHMAIVYLILTYLIGLAAAAAGFVLGQL